MYKRQIQDIVGAMVSGNTETGIDATYDDATGKINFVVTGGGGTADGVADAISFTANTRTLTLGRSVGADLTVVLPLTTATDAGLMSSSAFNKLANIEPNATADQTGAEMVTALSGLSGSARLPFSAVQGEVPASQIDDLITRDTELANLVKSASISGRIITLTQHDDTTITITLPADSGGLSTAQVQAVVGAMFTGNDEDGVLGEYNAATQKIDLDSDVGDATTSQSGLMSSTDKTKLDNLSPNAEENVNADWDAASGDARVLNKPAIVTAISYDAASRIITLTLDTGNTYTATLPEATESAPGLLSHADKTKLDGLMAGGGGGTATLDINQVRFVTRYPASGTTRIGGSVVAMTPTTTAPTLVEGTTFGTINQAGNYFTLPVGIYHIGIDADMQADISGQAELIAAVSTNNGSTYTNIAPGISWNAQRSMGGSIILKVSNSTHRYQMRCVLAGGNNNSLTAALVLTQLSTSAGDGGGSTTPAAHAVYIA